MLSAKRALLLAALAPLAALTACGDPAPPPSPDGTARRGVVTSSSDCAALGASTLDDCTSAIERAVAEHEATAPSYPTLKACEKDLGPDRCERTMSRSFRPRLMAFLVVMTTPPQAAPLYPTPKNEVGFRTANHSLILADDDGYTFSSEAIAASGATSGTMAASGGGMGF